MRIIYKIKSSWDFISSQILIYLKRRWNSKMAISIKNHEDRITALEKVSSFKIELLYSGSGQNSDTGKTITLSQPYTNFDAIVFQYCDGATAKDDWRQSTLFTKYIHDSTGNAQDSVYAYNLWFIESQTFQINFRSDKKSILISEAKQTVVREVFGLKLYYNFSYNITREFYKVKFKLKHYLCSHLQNSSKREVNLKMAISLYELSQRISSSIPLGTIVPYYGTDEPSGWKICDGRSCAGSELAKKLGISNVPDLRGRFIRMIGGNAAGMAVAQGDMFKKHNHNRPAYTSNTPSSVGGQLFGGYDQYGPGTLWVADVGGVETRPINMAFNYIIKVNTNVILYYVSNIIYKAIAIGKSLLSRAKEEVRRTMAISLNNHESRIVALENINTTNHKFVEIIPRNTVNTGGKTVTVPNLSQFDLLIFNSYTNDRSPNRVFYSSVISYDEFKYKTVSECGTRDHYCRVQYVSDTSIKILATEYGFVGCCYGLKQYYCFSNNIILYRLTQILFDSSLLVLFSQKGGARTI